MVSTEPSETDAKILARALATARHGRGADAGVGARPAIESHAYFASLHHSAGRLDT